jgi:hypothetical protein
MTSMIYNFLNCGIFLNIFFAMYYYYFYYYARILNPIIILRACPYFAINWKESPKKCVNHESNKNHKNNRTLIFIAKKKGWKK